MKILYVDIDTLLPDHLGCYGYSRNTSPNIDAIAAEGVRFYDYCCSDENDLAIILVHHLRKLTDDTDPFNRISGSTGLTGAADTMIVLERTKRKDASTIIHMTGRDIEAADIEVIFDKATCTWKRYEGDEEDSADEYRLSGLQQGLNGILEGQSEWEGSASQLLTLARSWSGREVAKSPRSMVELLFRCEQRMKELDGITVVTYRRGGGKTLYRIAKL